MRFDLARWEGSISAATFRFGRNDDERDEIAQLIRIHLFERWASISDESDCYIRAVIWNRARDFVRDHAIRGSQQVSLTGLHDALEPLSDPFPSLDVSSARVSSLVAIWQQMTSTERKIIAALFLRGTGNAAADAIGMNSNTFRAKVYRFREKAVNAWERPA